MSDLYLNIFSHYDKISKSIDHSLLQPNLSQTNIEDGCLLAIKYNVALVMCRPNDIVFANKILSKNNIKIGCAVGFPHGGNTTATKVFETYNALKDGAEEIDMVINIGMIKSAQYLDAENDIFNVVKEAQGKIVKVILENSYLTNEEKILSCKIAENAGASFVKTSSGYAPTGANIEDIKIMKSALSKNVKIKAAGGIRSLNSLLEYANAGVSRFGATATKNILDEYRVRTGLEPIE